MSDTPEKCDACGRAWDRCHGDAECTNCELLSAGLDRLKEEAQALLTQVTAIRAELDRTKEFLAVREAIHHERLLECERLRGDLKRISAAVAAASNVQDGSTYVYRHTKPPGGS